MGFVRRFLRNRLAVLGAGIIAAFLAGAVFAPALTTFNPIRMDLGAKLTPPGSTHLLGTDELGRDLLARILYGARTSLFTGVLVVAIGLGVGGAIGVVGGWYEGTLDQAVGVVVDTMLSIPGILLALALVAALGPGAEKAAVSIGIATIPNFARLVRSTVLSVKRNAYVEAARAIGAREAAVIFAYVLPNGIAPIMVLASYQMATAMLTIATLSFIGLGAQPPLPEWGSMLARGRDFVRVAPYYPIVAGMPIILVVLGFNLVGDGFRDALDPRLSRLT
ncbi:MAG: ABC transporter permease [Armatimonadetes bacterium]|nr:ABC transporter permease [Armatimonadota bacterium]